MQIFPGEKSPLELQRRCPFNRNAVSWDSSGKPQGQEYIVVTLRLKGHLFFERVEGDFTRV